MTYLVHAHPNDSHSALPLSSTVPSTSVSAIPVRSYGAALLHVLHDCPCLTNLRSATTDDSEAQTAQPTPVLSLTPPVPSNPPSSTSSSSLRKHSVLSSPRQRQLICLSLPKQFRRRTKVPDIVCPRLNRRTPPSYPQVCTRSLTPLV